MKKSVVLSITLVVLFLLLTACSLLEEEPLPTLVPVIQLPEPEESAPTAVAETAESPESVDSPAGNESVATPAAALPAANIDIHGALVYINSTGGGLYLTRPDGSEEAQYYALQNVAQLLPASFNGERIGLIRDGQLSIARTDGSGIVEVTAVAEPSWLSWSPTNDEFALIDNGDLVVIQADSAAINRLTTGMQLADIPGSVAWSPDGSQLLFTCGSQATNLCRVAINGGAVDNLTNNGPDSFAWYREPVWSPDGSLISYVSPDENKELQLFVMDVNGNDVRQLTIGSGQNSLHSWSPDGQFIAYANLSDGVWRALAIEVAGGDVVTLSEALPLMEAVVPQWGPDESQVTLLYSTELEADAIAVAVVALEDTTVIPITENGWQVQWSADGRQIAYISSEAQIYLHGVSPSGIGSPTIIDCPSGCESFVWLP